MKKRKMKLLDPISINGLYLKNRIVMPAMCTEYANSDGTVTEKMINYYVERAKGGAALLITEMAYVNPLGKGFQHMFAIHDDILIDSLKRLTQSIHEVDGKIFLQIAHVGRRAPVNLIGCNPVGPSPIASIGSLVPRELSLEEIESLENDFSNSARRAKEAGFDGIEIHMAHGYLISQFMSNYSNKRNDEYGGSFENRCRFALNIVRKVRQMIGREYPVFCKINGDDYLSNGKGVSLKESVKLAQMLENIGVDAITVSGGIMETGEMITPPMSIKPGCHVHLACEIKRHVNIPVIAIGRINSVSIAEETVQQGNSDLVAMGRALIADPFLPLKIKENRLAEIRPCISCGQGCTDRLLKDLEIRCLVNPNVGREGSISNVKGDNRLVMIIGGGPAGMQAGIEAKNKGFQVKLFEKSSRLGGQLNLAGKPPFKGDINCFGEYLLNELKGLNIEVILNTSPTVTLIKEENPDFVVLATGAVPMETPFPVKDSVIQNSWDILNGTQIEGDRIVIVGGGMVGCETAEYLAEQGKRVTIIEMLADFAVDMQARPRKLLINRLVERGVNFLPHTKALGIVNNKLYYQRSNIKDFMAADGFVISIGANADKSLEKELFDNKIRYILIGDCLKPRKIIEAIHEGFNSINYEQNLL